MLKNKYFLHDREIKLGVVVESDQARNACECVWMAVEYFWEKNQEKGMSMRE